MVHVEGHSGADPERVILQADGTFNTDHEAVMFLRQNHGCEVSFYWLEDVVRPIARLNPGRVTALRRSRDAQNIWPRRIPRFQPDLEQNEDDAEDSSECEESDGGEGDRQSELSEGAGEEEVGELEEMLMALQDEVLVQDLADADAPGHGDGELAPDGGEPLVADHGGVLVPDGGGGEPALDLPEPPPPPPPPFLRPLAAPDGPARRRPPKFSLGICEGTLAFSDGNVTFQAMCGNAFYGACSESEEHQRGLI